jgi:hypothetical protein
MIGEFVNLSHTHVLRIIRDEERETERLEKLEKSGPPRRLSRSRIIRSTPVPGSTRVVCLHSEPSPR